LLCEVGCQCLKIVEDPVLIWELRADLAVLLDAATPFVKFTYAFEGDGFWLPFFHVRMRELQAFRKAFSTSDSLQPQIRQVFFFFFEFFFSLVTGCLWSISHGRLWSG
jgi:hypothetical protein